MICTYYMYGYIYTYMCACLCQYSWAGRRCHHPRYPRSCHQSHPNPNLSPNSLAAHQNPCPWYHLPPSRWECHLVVRRETGRKNECNVKGGQHRRKKDQPSHVFRLTDSPSDFNRDTPAKQTPPGPVSKRSQATFKSTISVTCLLVLRY